MATLTGIRIRNFKAVGEAVAEITLAPITLLYGPNGAGKSTILHALHYAREILERGNLDPDRTLGGGELDLGGFKNLIHGRDLKRDIVLGFDFETFEMGMDFVPNMDGFGLAVDAGRLMFPDHVEQAGVELTLRYSQVLDRPYVARLSVRLMGEQFVTIEASSDLKNVELLELAEDHPVLNEAGHSDEDPDRGIGVVLFAGKPSRRIGLFNSSGALPSLDKPLHPDFEDHPSRLGKERRERVTRSGLRLDVTRPGPSAEDVADLTEQKAVADYLSALIIGPLQQLREALRGLIPIGPIRAVPPRGYRPQRSPDLARWTSGLAAWDRLATMNADEVALVDEWLDEKLGSGFGVRVERTKPVAVNGRLGAVLQRGPTIDDLDELRASWAALPEIFRIVLTDSINQVDVEPSDIGVGLSQVLPIVVAALDPMARIVAIEQPELHVHPRLQTGIGDLFTAALEIPTSDETGENVEISHFKPVDPANPLYGTNGRLFLIETHSEHLVLRLLRRIRETAEGTLKPGSPVVLPSLVAVHYVEPQNDGMRLKRLRIDQTGEFIDRWPDGFFEEREDELF